MTFVHLKKDQFFFQLGTLDKALLFQLIERYPLVPPNHFQTSVHPEKDLESQFINDLLIEERQENKKKLNGFFTSVRKFSGAGEEGSLLAISFSEMQWLLQVLNDIRVGAWIQLGSPDESGMERFDEGHQLNEQSWAMNLSSRFQGELLSALDQAEAMDSPSTEEFGSEDF
ncbi:MAG: hypothetical protein JWN25_2974 [Verrucomicrobiales bacterium]|nr:hypothetical protein [Verrucomicrobiales bacterium]